MHSLSRLSIRICPQIQWLMTCGQHIRRLRDRQGKIFWWCSFEKWPYVSRASLHSRISPVSIITSSGPKFPFSFSQLVRHCHFPSLPASATKAILNYAWFVLGNSALFTMMMQLSQSVPSSWEHLQAQASSRLDSSFQEHLISSVYNKLTLNRNK